MSNPIHDFLKTLRRTLTGARYVPGRRSTVAPLEYRLVGSQDPLVGTILGQKYQIIDRVGAGGMSVVYKAKQEPINRIVAVKLLKREWTNDPLTVKRFQREARAVSSLRHPNVLMVMDIGKADGGQPYFVCEFLKGKSLEETLTEQGFLTEQRAIPIFIQVCEAMAHAHKNGLIHRDLKPGNIMLLDEPERKDFVKLVDFGIVKISDKAQAVSQKLTQKGEIWGSPTYMSPEQCMGNEIDGRSDIYSLGTVIYETLVGKVAFDGKTIPQIIVKQLNEMPPRFEVSAPDKRLSAYMESIVFRALEKDPGNRFQSMEELKEALENCLRNKGVLPASPKAPLLKPPEVVAVPLAEKQTPPKPTVSRQGSKQSPLIITAAILAACILLAAGFGIYQLAKNMLAPAISVTVIKTERSDDTKKRKTLEQVSPVVEDSQTVPRHEKPAEHRRAAAQMPEAQTKATAGGNTTAPATKTASEKHPASIPSAATAKPKKKPAATATHRTEPAEIDESLYLRKRRNKDAQQHWHDYQSKEASSP